MKKLLLTAALCIGFTSSGYAQGVPVVDPAAILKLVAITEQLREDYAVQTQQLQTIMHEYQTLLQTLENARAQLEALKGDKGIAALFEAAGIDTFNEGAFGSLVDLYGSISSGDFTDLISVTLPDGTTGVEIANELLGSVGMSQELITELSASTSYNDRSVAHQAGSGVGLSIQAQHSYQVAAKHTEALAALTDQVDNTQDVKASTDLGTLATIQLGYAIAELIRVESASASAQAQAMISQAGGTANAAQYSNFTVEE
ncbi:MAG: type IV secretion system protein [Rhizobiaceae bacterium]